MRAKGKILVNGKVVGEAIEFLPYDPKRLENVQVFGEAVVELVPCNYKLHFSTCRGCNDTEHICITGDRAGFHSCEEHCECEDEK